MTVSSQKYQDSQVALAEPLVSVITPTWKRHKLLLDRCIPSVQAQTYPRVEHIVVSDGPDPELTLKFIQPGCWTEYPRLWYFQLDEHDPAEHWGHHARRHGLDYASGQLIAYVDDDDALRPDHCALLAAALEEDPEAGFAVSRMMCHADGRPDTVVGWGPLARGNVGTPMIMHRRELLDIATWDKASFTEDWDLVERWLDAGVKYANVNAETADVWPGMFR